jgi:hypothetical protein
MVKYRVEDLLETVGLIAQDDDFWNRLENADHPPSSEQLERVKRIDPLAFAALLEAAGYRSPPPPSVEELVDETIQALIVAVTTPSRTQIEEAGGARWQLRTLVMRVRIQIDEQKVPELAPSVIRSSARALGRAARWLIPRAVAATAGAAVEAHSPGSGLALLAWPSLTRTAEDLGELTADMIIGNPSPAPEMADVDESAWTEIDPLDAHLAALIDQVSAFNRFSGGASSDKLKQMLNEMHRHLNRIEELIIDNDLETTDFRDLIATSRYYLERVNVKVAWGGEERVVGKPDAIRLSIELLRDALGRLRRTASP